MEGNCKFSTMDCKCDILYPQEEIRPDGRIVVVETDAQLSTIDAWIQENLSYGVDIFIMSPRHNKCHSENDEVFRSLISNEDDNKKVLFVVDRMIKSIKILEDTYHGDPIVTTERDNFLWECISCNLPFKNM